MISIQVRTQIEVDGLRVLSRVQINTSILKYNAVISVQSLVNKLSKEPAEDTANETAVLDRTTVAFAVICFRLCAKQQRL